MLTRHFLDVPESSGRRRVHYRRCGKGPPLLMVHQSPRSSAEYEPLMQAWGAHFTCIAPDTPGFGQSEPLSEEPEIGDFAAALLDTLDALGIERCAAYGFHSGAVILMEALRLDPSRFSRVAMGGYAVWTAEEARLFGERYLPPLVPQPYGEHLTWLWNRMLEQSWFFPWFDARPEARLLGAHADVGRVHAAVMEMLDAGEAYRAGYGAVLRAERAIPAQGPPTLITAFDGDPLQAHLERLGSLPDGWEARPVRSAAEHHDASLAWLLDGMAGAEPGTPEAADEGFAAIGGRLIHWLGEGDRLRLHAPGGEARSGHGIAVDLPGHGLSDPAQGDEPWLDTIAACERHFGTGETEADGATAALLGGPRLEPEVAERLLPDLAPDRFGSHLTRAWSVARASRLFEPWYHADAAHARSFTSDEIEPAQIAIHCRALLRATGGRQLLAAAAQAGGS